MAKSTIKKTLRLQLLKIDGTLPPLEDKKVHNVSLTEYKIPKNMAEPMETVIIVYVNTMCYVNKNSIQTYGRLMQQCVYASLC